MTRRENTNNLDQYFGAPIKCETKRNETKRNQRKRNEAKSTKTKRNEINEMKTKLFFFTFVFHCVQCCKN
jgi:hypothetical protein